MKNRVCVKPGGAKPLSGTGSFCVGVKRAVRAVSRTLALAVLGIGATAAAAQAQSAWSNPSVSLSFVSDNVCIAGPYSNGTETQVQVEWTAYNAPTNLSNDIKPVKWQEYGAGVRLSVGPGIEDAPGGQLPLQQTVFSARKAYDLVASRYLYVGLDARWDSGHIWMSDAPYEPYDTSPTARGASGWERLDMATDPDCVAPPEVPEINVTGNGVDIADGDGSARTADHTDFGTVDILTGSVSHTFTISNTGTGALTLGANAASVSGTNAADFTVTSQPATSVAAGDSTTVTVLYDPSATGTRNATLSIANDDSDESPYNFALRGGGSASPEISVTGNGANIVDGTTSSASTANHTNFGSADVLTETITRTFTITNEGSAYLTLGNDAASVSGPFAANFTILSQPSFNVAPGGSTSVSVEFDPHATGTHFAFLSIANNDSNESPFNFRIQGTGTGESEIAVTGNGVDITDGDSSPSTTDHTDFGSVNVDSGTVSRTFTITNSGGENMILGVDAASLSGPDAGDFSITAQPLDGISRNGGTTSVTVEFDPSAIGTRSATLSIANDDSDESPFDFTIQGTGIGTPEIAVTGNGTNIVDGDSSPSSGDHTDFGSANPSGGTVSRTFTITNSGTDTLVLGSGAVSVSGVNATDFSVTAQPATSVAAGGGTTTFTVEFDPSITGAHSATLSIANNDVDESPFDFAVQGIGEDVTAPSGYAVVFNQPSVNAANETAVSFDFGGAEVGAGYDYTISSNNGGAPVSGSGTIATATDTISGIDVSGLNDGTLTLSFTLTDDSGNTGSAETDTVNKDATAPSGYSVTLGQDPVTAANETAVSFTFAGGEASADYAYMISSNNGGANVTGSGTLSGATDAISGIDVSGLNDGTLTLSVTLTDPAGNTGTAATDTAEKDTGAPSGYSVSFDQAAVNAGNADAVSFTFAGAEVGTDYDYTITSSHGGGSVTGSGTIATASDRVDGIDVLSLVDGTLTLSVRLTDSGGNIGSAATDTVSKDVVVPSGYSVSLDQDPVTAANETAVSFTFTGGQASADYAYTISSDNGGTDVTGSGTLSGASDTVSSIDVSGLNDGTLTLSVTLTDTAGNTGSAATDTAEKDTGAPSGYSIAFDQDPVNASNETSVAFTFAAAEVGADYDYAITSSGGGSSATGSGTITTATDQIDSIDVSGLGDGTLTLSVTLTDSGGNSGTAVTDTATKDTAVPSGYSVAFDQDPVTSANEAAISFTFVSAEVGAGYDYTITSSGGGGSVTGSGTIATAADAITDLDVSSLNDGTLTLSVTLTDTAGNTGSAATDTATKDATAPSGYTATFDQDPVTAANDDAISFTFTAAEAGADYDYTITSSGGAGSVTGSGMIATATDQIDSIDVSGLTDGTLTLSVTLTDTAGNTGSAATDTASKDATASAGYSVAFDQDPVTAVNETAISFTFAAAEAGADYDYTITSSGGGGSVTGSGMIATATDQIDSIDVSGLADGTLTLSATLTDSGGNTGAAATDTVSKDAAAPAGYSVTFDQDPVTSANETAISFTFGAAEVGADYDYTITSAGGGGSVTGSGAIATATDQIDSIDVSGLPDGMLTLSVALTDGAGNAGSAVTDTASKDAAAPSGYSAAFDQDSVTAANETAISFTFASAEIGASYQYTITSAGGGGSVTASGTLVTATDQVADIDVSALPDGTLTLSVTITDTGGNTGTAATDTVNKDATAPSGYSAAFDQTLATSANGTAISFSFASAEAGADYDYTIASSGGGGSVTGSGTLATAADQIAGIDVSGLPDGTLTLSVTLTDTAGNTGPAVTDTVTKETDQPAFAMAFTPDSMLAGDVTTLSLTVDNSANGAAASALAFTDTLPSGMTVAPTPNASTTCTGGTLTATAGAGSLSYSGGSVAAGASCLFSVDVTASSAGTLVNTTGSLTSSLGDSGTASATLSVSQPSVVVDSPSVTEGDTGTSTLTFTVTLSVASPQSVTVDYATSDGTAEAGLDYTAASGTLTFTPGETTQTVPVTVLNDTAFEPDETLVLTLSGASNATIATATGTGTILTDDTDGVAPTLSGIARQSPAAVTTNADSLTWSVTFSEDVTGVDAGDFAVQGSTAAVTGVSGSGDTYAVVVSGGDLAALTGEVGLGLASGASIEDMAGNALTEFTPTGATETYDLDNTRPEVALDAGGAGVVTDAFTLTVTFSESVTGFELSDLTVAQATAGDLQTVSASVYTVQITPSGSGTIEISVSAGAAIDAAGNDSLASQGLTVEADAEGPGILSIEATGGVLTYADELAWRITFSEAVTGVDSADFALSGAGSTTLTVVAASATVYTVTATGGDIPDLNGAVTLGFAVGQDIADGAGNPLTDVEPSGTDQSVVELDNTVPEATAVTEPGEVTGPFTMTVSFSEPVTGFALDDLTLENATASNLVSVSASEYAIEISPETFGTVTVTVNAGAATDGAGNGSTGTALSIEAASPRVSVEIEINIDDEDPVGVAATATITNPGQRPTRFRTIADVPWLRVDPAEGEIPGNSEIELTVTITEAVHALGLGEYYGTVTLFQQDAAQTSGAAAEGGAANQETAIAEIPISLRLEGTRGTLQLVATTPAGIAGDASFTLASDIAAFDGQVLNTSGGRAQTAAVELVRGVFSVRQSVPAGWRVNTVSCSGDADEGSQIDAAAGTVQVDLDAGEAIICTFENVRDEDAVRLATQRAIRNFMLRRADRLIDAAPDLSRRLGTREAERPGGFAANADGGRYTMSLSASLSGVRNAVRAKEQAPGLAALEGEPDGHLDVWLSAEMSGVSDNRAGDRAETDFGVAQLGMDWAVSDDMLIGAMLQFDWMDETSREIFLEAGAVAGAEVSGDGWMAGPYLVWRFADGLIFDGSALYGHSRNTVNPLGLYEDEFNTDRWMLRANLTGEYEHGPWMLRPQATLTHFEETQAAYTDSLAIYIPQQTIALGRLTAGPEVIWRHAGNDGRQLELSAGLRAIWDYRPAELLNEAGLLTSGGSDMRADGSIGMNTVFANGAQLGLEISLSGIGQDDFEANSARLNLRYPLTLGR